MMMISLEELQAITTLVVTERVRQQPAQPWHTPGVLTAVKSLAREGRSVPAIVAAGFAAAADPNAATPVAMGFDRYRSSGGPVSPSKDRGPWCNGCGYGRPGHDAVTERGIHEPHEFRVDSAPATEQDRTGRSIPAGPVARAIEGSVLGGDLQ